MKILVVLRMMPDPAGEFAILPNGSGLDSEWLDYQLNDFDDQALEDAVLLKEAAGGSVTVAAIGEGANRVLQMSIARGANEAIVVEKADDGPLSSRWLAETIVAIARERSVDLIITGVQSAEDIFGQLAPMVGALLDWPHLSGTSRVAWAEGKLLASQERGGGIVANYRMALPAVLGVQTASKPPRYVSGSKLKEAAKTAIGRVAAKEYAASQAARLIGLSLPPSSGGSESLGATAKLAADRLFKILTDKGLIEAR